MTWRALEAAWLPFFGPRAEERARQAAAALDVLSGDALALYLRRNLETLNRDDVRFSVGHGTLAAPEGGWPLVSLGTIAEAVAAGMRAIGAEVRAA